MNLNDLRGEEREIKVFNDGKAGVVENVSIRIERKKPEDKEGSPDYKVFYVDAAGGEVNEGFWKNLSNSSEGQKKRVANRLLKLYDAVFGKDASKKLPDVKSLEEATDYVMMEVNKNAGNTKVRLAVNYGNAQYPQKYLRPCNWSWINNINEDPKNVSLDKDSLVEPVKADEEQSSEVYETKEADKSGW